MATKIIHKKSSVAGSIPVAGDLEAGELAVNLADRTIYSKTTGGAIVEMGVTNATTITETAKNVSGATLTIGTPVYQSGTAGNALEVQKAVAATSATMPAIGLLSSTLANTAEGEIVLTGFLNGIDTSSYSEGDTLYVGSAGGLTTTAPSGEGNLIQNIGKVIKVHASNGSIMVTGAGRANATPNLNNGNIFIGNGSNQATTGSLDTLVGNTGYIKDYTVTQGDVTAHQAALSITESQISDLGSYLTAHPSVSAGTSANNSGRTYIQDITLDSFGHVTGLASATETVVNTDTTYTNVSEFTNDAGYITGYTVTQGDVTAHQAALSITESQISDLGSYLTAHPAVLAETSVDNSGRTYIQDITLDSFGHVIGLASATETVVNTDTNTTYTAGSGLGLSGTTFSHSDTSSQASVNNSGRTYIQDITLDTYGHVTGLASATETVTNTDTNTTNLAVKNSSGTTQFTDDEISFAGSGATSVSFDAVTKKVTISSTDTNTDTNTTYSAGSGISLSGTTFSHTDTSSQASVNNSGRTYIQDITLDTYGHVTGLASATETVVNTDTNTNQLTTFVVEDGDGTEVTISHGKEWKFVEGGGIDINWSDTTPGSDADPFDLTISHNDTSSQASVNNSGRTYIQDITLDGYGHVTGIGSATETVVNTDTNTTDWRVQNSAGTQQFQVTAAEGVRFAGGGATSVAFDAATQKVTISSTDTNTNTTYSAGGGLSLSGTTFSHTDTSSQASVNNSGRTYIQDITLDGYGHVTGIASATETVTNTDTNTTNFNVQANGGTQVNISAGEEVNFINGNATTAVVTNQANPTVTFHHNDTSSQGSVNNSGRTYIQDITLDGYGHVTGLASATETVVNTDTNTTYSADGNYGMMLSGTAFRLENDRRRNATGEDVWSGNTHDYTHYDADVGIRWYTSGSEEMRLDTAGNLHVDANITAYSTTVSDINLKEDIKPITGALDMIEQLGGYTFTYKKDGKKSAGVIAQEVEKVLPSAVEDIDAVFHGEEGTTHKVVQYDQLHGVLIEAIKELKAEIEELKATACKCK